MAYDRFDDYSGPPTGWRSAAKKGGPEAQGLGRSRGGLTTKIHAAGDALGFPVRLTVGTGQEHNGKRAVELMEGLIFGTLLADKAYDADNIREKIEDQGADVVIPPKTNRKCKRDYDKDLYQERNLIERFFAKLKQFRQVATQYDKFAANFIGFVKIAAIAIWLR